MNELNEQINRIVGEKLEFLKTQFKIALGGDRLGRKAKIARSIMKRRRFPANNVRGLK